MEKRIKRKRFLSLLGVIFTMVLLFTFSGRTVKAAGDNSFNTTGGASKTYTFTDNSALIKLKTDKAGSADFIVKISGISKGKGDSAAQVYITDGEGRLCSAGNYTTPGKKTKFSASFTSKKMVCTLLISKPEKDKGNNKKVTVTLTPKTYTPLVKKARSLTAKEKITFVQDKGTLYWKLNLTKNAKLKMSISNNSGVLVDSKKKEIDTIDSDDNSSYYYLQKGNYYIKTENDADISLLSPLSKQNIDLSYSAIKGTVWTRNTKIKSALKISLNKKVSGTILTKDSYKSRYFKLTLKKKAKISVTNNLKTKGKGDLYLLDSKGELLDINKKLPAGTYYLELVGKPGPYSFTVK